MYLVCVGFSKDSTTKMITGEYDEANVGEEIITTDDILEVLDEMGLQFERQEDVDKLLEAVLELEFSSCDESLFLEPEDIDADAVPPQRTISNHVPAFASPVRPRTRGEETVRSEYFSAPGTTRTNQQQTAHVSGNGNAEADHWIAEAYNRMAHIYSLCEDFTSPHWGKASEKLERFNVPTTRSSRATSERNDQNKENEPASRFPVRKSSAATSVMSRNAELPTVALSSQASGNPVLRPVLNPSPGRLAYRHDPVKRWEQAREEWARLPPPHEKKRLRLRWKVREYMLRQDPPQYDPRNPRGPVLIQKEWSPRPYLP